MNLNLLIILNSVTIHVTFFFPNLAVSLKIVVIMCLFEKIKIFEHGKNSSLPINGINIKRNPVLKQTFLSQLYMRREPFTVKTLRKIFL